ncbi:hypothetical protein AGMMS49992_18730 [Clostridia bacterium]|nr:hypothetical protein AGMMS49992_18730 [Clostridia bacterium]
MEKRKPSAISSIEEEYENLPDSIRAELIGQRIVMLDFATISHNNTAGEIYSKLKGYLNGKKCRALFDVPIQLDSDKPDTLRPDIAVVCDPSKIHDRRIVGVPDMIVEVLSPSNAGHDRKFKRRVYEKAGVAEYWIVDTKSRRIDVLLLKDGAYVPTTYTRAQSIKVSTLDDCVIDLTYAFEAEA